VSKKPREPSTSNPGWFPKGRSGNTKGRPRGTRVTTGSAFEVLVDKTLTVPDGGGTREIPFKEALHLQTFRDALAGKAMAMREVLKWIRTREAWLVKHEPKAHKKIPWLISSVDPDNADDALLLLGIEAEDPRAADFDANRAQLLLEPWAVQAALRRRRGGQRLTEQELATVTGRTRDPDTLRWPRGPENDVAGGNSGR
jgi:Family of unknown function (DUF5681)